MPVANQVLVFYALINGFIDDVKVEDVIKWEAGLNRYAETNGEAVLTEITKGEYSDELEVKMKSLISDYKSTL